MAGAGGTGSSDAGPDLTRLPTSTPRLMLAAATALVLVAVAFLAGVRLGGSAPPAAPGPPGSPLSSAAIPPLVQPGAVSPLLSQAYAAEGGGATGGWAICDIDGTPTCQPTRPTPAPLATFARLVGRQIGPGDPAALAAEWGAVLHIRVSGTHLVLVAPGLLASDGSTLIRVPSAGGSAALHNLTAVPVGLGPVNYLDLGQLTGADYLAVLLILGPAGSPQPAAPTDLFQLGTEVLGFTNQP